MQANGEILKIILPLFFGLGIFLFLWLAIMYLTSITSGWGKLSKHYLFKERNTLPILEKSFQSAQFGWANYNYIIKFLFYPDGLGIEVFTIFAFKHPKLFIPWKDIYLKEIDNSLFSRNKIEIGNPNLTNMRINKSNLETMLPYLNKSNSKDDNW